MGARRGGSHPIRLPLLAAGFHPVSQPRHPGLSPPGSPSCWGPSAARGWPQAVTQEGDVLSAGLWINRQTIGVCGAGTWQGIGAELSFGTLRPWGWSCCRGPSALEICLSEASLSQASLYFLYVSEHAVNWRDFALPGVAPSPARPSAGSGL